VPTPRKTRTRRIIESGPIPPIHGVVRWRLIYLAHWLWEAYRTRIAKQTLSRQLRAMGFRNQLVDRPWIMSIGMRDWAHGS
jgi:hypothetical protein